jgi:glucose/arabinose dehydrogenase
VSVARLAAASAFALLIAGCDESNQPDQYGPNPQLPEPQRGLLPAMTIADPAGWGDRRPEVPQGYTISAIATDLKVPRQTLVLPNGDILVAEGKGGNAPALRPKDIISGYFKSKGTTSVEGGDRLTLLRDADGDGRYEARYVFAENLNAPYGLALIGNRLFVANQDAVVRFDYQPGQTRASAPPVEFAPLPAAINHHWTKAMTAGPDGRFLYVGIGSNSNIGERGMAVEEERAMVWQIDAETGASRRYATGLRNPTALAIHPDTGQLWAVVNERDELGSHLVPDYLTSVREGAFYGWPYAYWGANPDKRVRPFKEDMVAKTVRPDYALPSHSAPLGLAFSTPAMGARFARGVFVGMHGSWNREKPVGYKVVFVPLQGGRPNGNPIDVVTGFQADGKTFGRPVGVTVDPRGALVVADDLSNTIWRMTPTSPTPQATVPPASQPGGQAEEPNAGRPAEPR